jgi:hypothetical protein
MPGILNSTVFWGKLHPEQVTDYAEYVRRRETYDRTQARFSAFRRWPELVPSK